MLFWGHWAVRSRNGLLSREYSELDLKAGRNEARGGSCHMQGPEASPALRDCASHPGGQGVASRSGTPMGYSQEEQQGSRGTRWPD